MATSTKQRILTVTDPVCGVDLEYVEARYYSDVGDEVFYFCSDDCKKVFDVDYKSYVDPNNWEY